MDMGPVGKDLPLIALPLDLPVPTAVLCRRRNGVSFCSSTSYFTVPRYERRGGISYERADINAIYVRALGDGKSRSTKVATSPDLGRPAPGRGLKRTPVFDWEVKLIDKVSQPKCKLRFRTRFMSVHGFHRRRHSKLYRSQKNKQVFDESYSHPAKMLQACGNWDFDVFHLDILTGGRPLLYLAHQIFMERGLITSFKLDVFKLLRFVSSIEDNYHDSNPYHDVLHAADVTQALYCYLREDKLQQCMEPFEVMVAILSAMAHDVDHPGLNQTFLERTQHHLAQHYQSKSVLEHHHWNFGVTLLRESGLFSHFEGTQWSLFISLFSSIILATDISYQRMYVQQFKEMLNENRYDLANCTTRHFILKIAMKCSDICNPCRKWPVSETWSRQVCEEFFNQGDLERRRGLAVTETFDRYKTSVAKIQIGFMEYVVHPLMKEWNRFLPTELSERMLANMEANKQKWKDVQAEENKTAAEHGPGPSSFSAPTRNKESAKNVNRNNMAGSLEEVVWMLEEEGLSDQEEEKEEEEDGEEADTVDNNINLAFHYQTDSEQLSEGGCHSLPPLCEEDQLRFLAISARRHSMPVAVRKDLGYYLGLRQDSCACYNFLRRQSLPATSGKTSWSESRRETGDFAQKEMSGEGLKGRPKISPLGSVIDPQLHSLTFLPLQTQTQRLQQCAIENNSARTFPSSQPSSSCLEFRRRSQVSREDTERVKNVLSRIVTGARMCHQELIGLASSWPTIRRDSQKVDEDELKLLADQFELPSPDSSTESSSLTSRSNSNDSLHVSLSPPPTLRLLSRRH